MDMDADAFTNLLISLVGGLVGVVFVLLRADIKNLRADLNGLRGEFNEFRSDMNRRFDEVLATQKEHGERLSRLETLVAVLMGQFRPGGTDPETGEQAMLAFRARGQDEADEA